jgi:PAS domain S-box-containing protein
VPNIFEEPKDRPWYHLAEELGFSSQIFTPMKRGNKVIGLLNVYMAEPHQFTEEEINFVSIAASQAASVVQNARLCTRLKNNIHELNDYKEHLEEMVKESCRKLFESENYLRTLIESSFDGVLVIDEQGRFEFINDSGLQILGWPARELLGESFMKVIPEDMEKFMLDRWHEIQNGIEGPYETKIITKNNDIKNLHVSHARGEINGIRKYVVIIKDITEHKKLELALKESEAKYRELFENADDPMFTLDTEGRFMDMNTAGILTLRCSKDELIGSHLSDWVTPESAKIAQEAIEKCLAGEPVKSLLLLEVVPLKGEHRWVEVKSRGLTKNGKIIGIHGVARDITEKINLANKLRQSNRQLNMLWYLIVGTRGGATRSLILKHLINGPHNANQLAKALNMDYKTIRHHLNVLVKKGVIIREKYEKSGTIYFLSKSIEGALEDFDFGIHSHDGGQNKKIITPNS